MASMLSVPAHPNRPVARAVGMFTLAGIVALAGVALATNAASHRAGIESAVRDATRNTDLLARTAIEPELRNSLVDADPAAVAVMDAEIRGRVLDQDLVRVKLWRQDGMIVYSDQPQLIGATYGLGADE